MTNLPSSSSSDHRSESAVSTVGGQALTVSQALQYFALTLKKPNNYLRIVRCYLEYCIAHHSNIDQISSSLYTVGQRPSRISPVRKFVRFAAEHQIVRVVADPESSTVPPAANELILGYLSEANLREESKATYTRSLNAFFAYLAAERLGGTLVNFSHLTVRKYIGQLKKDQISPFTIQVRLSAIKGLARWVVDHHDRLPGHRSSDASVADNPVAGNPVVLNGEQLEGLRGIDRIRSPRVELQFHRDGLSEEDRSFLLDVVPDSKWQAIITLMGWCGLRTVEVTRLLVRDVDFAAARLYVQGKGKDDKVAVQLLEECAYFLQLYIKEYGDGDQRSDGWHSGGRPASSSIKRSAGHRAPGKQGNSAGQRPGNEPLFPGLTTRQIRYHTKKYLEQAHLKTPRVSAHSLRHTTGQVLLKQGVDPIYVQRHLRHKSFATTQIYVQQQSEKEYFEQVGQLVDDHSDPKQ